MTLSEQHRLHVLASAVCGGCISSRELRELEGMLSEGEQAQRLYVSHLEVHGALAEVAPHLPGNSGLPRIVREDSVENNCDALELRRSSGSLLSRYRETLAWTLATCAVVLLVVGHFWSWQSTPVATALPAASLAGNLGPIHFGPGTLRMGLPNIGTMVVEGPAEMQWISPMHLKLDRGKIQVRVTEESGKGFLVSTPHGDVKDLGTEFGLDVANLDASNLVVFDGKVDLSVPGLSTTPLVERLTRGDGVRFASNGQFDRIMSIITGNGEMFSPADHQSSGLQPLIVNVTDNLPPNKTRRFFEIVSGGFGEDTPAYVDRPYEWNGVTREGLPEFLLGADYVKTFNDYKNDRFQITVELSQPCTLYVLWDERVKYPEWLKTQYEKSDARVGLDEAWCAARIGMPDKHLGVGPGVSIAYEFTVWQRHVKKAGKVVLGALNTKSDRCNLYGIAAVPLQSAGAGPDVTRSLPAGVPLAKAP